MVDWIPEEFEIRPVTLECVHGPITSTCLCNERFAVHPLVVFVRNDDAPVFSEFDYSVTHINTGLAVTGSIHLSLRQAIDVAQALAADHHEEWDSLQFDRPTAPGSNVCTSNLAPDVKSRMRQCVKDAVESALMTRLPQDDNDE